MSDKIKIATCLWFDKNAEQTAEQASHGRHDDDEEDRHPEDRSSTAAHDVNRLLIAAITITLACTSSPPCGPIAPHDAGGCGKTFDLDYDPTTQTGCSFTGGVGTSDTCASLCGATASCELVTFSTVECTTTCGD